jgi:hypothetical protein
VNWENFGKLAYETFQSAYCQRAFPQPDLRFLPWEDVPETDRRVWIAMAKEVCDTFAGVVTA